MWLVFPILQRFGHVNMMTDHTHLCSVWIVLYSSNQHNKDTNSQLVGMMNKGPLSWECNIIHVHGVNMCPFGMCVFNQHFMAHEHACVSTSGGEDEIYVGVWKWISVRCGAWYWHKIQQPHFNQCQTGLVCDHSTVFFCQVTWIQIRHQ